MIKTWHIIIHDVDDNGDDIYYYGNGDGEYYCGKTIGDMARTLEKKEFDWQKKFKHDYFEV